MPQPKVDMVNRPPHYANPDKKIETIDKIEDAVQFAPNAVIGGLHWQTLKYLDRLWLKDNPLEDAKKARWYLERMIKKLEDWQFPVIFIVIITVFFTSLSQFYHL